MTAFQDHLDGTVTTLCHCWRVRLADGTSMGFTDHDRPLTVGGTAYEPESGMSASEVRSTEGLGMAAAEVAGALSSDAITEADILDGRYDGAIVETRLVNWAEPAQNRLVGRAAIAKITRSDGKFVAELESAARGLDQVRGRHLARHCDARLGDSRCRKSLGSSAFTGSGAVAATEGPGAIVATGIASYAENWFAGGEIRWTSGAKAGLSERVAGSRPTPGGTLVTYWSETASQPGPGDGFTIVAGCDKRFATCRSKFDNALNFRGFPHLPGNDSAYSYVNRDGEFDGKALVR